MCWREFFSARSRPGPAVREAHTFQIVAEVGVVFLMFSIGLEFSLEELREVKWVSLIGAPVGVVLSALLGEGVGCCWAGARCKAWWWG